MTVTAEVKTGQRRVIEFFLSPLLRYKQESLGERHPELIETVFCNGEIPKCLT